MVLAAWLVALPLASASFPAWRRGVRGSTVLRAVDDVMPAAAQQLPDDLRKLLDISGFPDVLSPFAETPITEVGPPDPALAEQRDRQRRAATACSRSAPRRRRAAGSWRAPGSSSVRSW